MKSVKIRLSTIEDVRKFVDIMLKYPGETDLSSGRYIVDAKSIMGIFSLDLMNPIMLTAQDEDAPAMFKEIEPFKA